MPSMINRLAFGLIDLIGSTNQGDNPSQLGDQVAPVLDVRDLYLSERLTYFQNQSTFNPGNNSSIDNIVIPIGQVWRLISMSARFTGAAAGDNMKMALSVQNFPNNSLDGAGATSKQVILSARATADSVGDLATIHYQWADQYWLLGGGKVEWQVTDNQLTLASDVFVDLLYHRLDT